MNSRANSYYNEEGYPDPTAHAGIKAAAKESEAVDKRAYDLIKVLKFMIASCGFELTERIKLRDIRTRKEYK